MYQLKVISSTVRPGRKGPALGRWITEHAQQSGNFEAEFIDLGELALPLMNESAHPRLKQYKHEYTKQWSKIVDAADAFIFVTAEYDYSYPASLKNALEYLVHEWAYKPAGIASYSAGPFAGVRAAHSLKNDLLSLKTISLAEVVNIPFVDQLINPEGLLTPTEQLTKNADIMLAQLLRWTKGLKVIKEDS